MGGFLRWDRALPPAPPPHRSPDLLFPFSDSIESFAAESPPPAFPFPFSCRRLLLQPRQALRQLSKRLSCTIPTSPDSGASLEPLLTATKPGVHRAHDAEEREPQDPTFLGNAATHLGKSDTEGRRDRRSHRRIRNLDPRRPPPPGTSAGKASPPLCLELALTGQAQPICRVLPRVCRRGSHRC